MILQKFMKTPTHCPTQIHTHMPSLPHALLRSSTSWRCAPCLPLWTPWSAADNLRTSYCDGSGFGWAKGSSDLMGDTLPYRPWFRRYHSAYLFISAHLSEPIVLLRRLFRSDVSPVLSGEVPVMLILNMSRISQEETSYTHTHTHTDRAYKIVNYELTGFFCQWNNM